LDNNKGKKAVIYFCGSIAFWILISMIYTAISVVTWGVGTLCFGIYLIPMIYPFVVAYDTYKVAKGEHPILPEFN